MFLGYQVEIQHSAEWYTVSNKENRRYLPLGVTLQQGIKHILNSKMALQEHSAKMNGIDATGGHGEGRALKVGRAREGRFHGVMVFG